MFVSTREICMFLQLQFHIHYFVLIGSQNQTTGVVISQIFHQVASNISRLYCWHGASWSSLPSEYLFVAIRILRITMSQLSNRFARKYCFVTQILVMKCSKTSWTFRKRHLLFHWSVRRLLISFCIFLEYVLQQVDACRKYRQWGIVTRSENYNHSVRFLNYIT